MSGVLIAAPSSGSGKTTITLGLLRALRNSGHDVMPGKAGPDYIDPAYHAIASGRECFNFDCWAMRPPLLEHQVPEDGVFVVEAMMGLYDSSADGSGSPAELAKRLGLSVILVVDCSRMSQSVGALVHGYASFDPAVSVRGLILNRVGSEKHERLLRRGLAHSDIPVLGVVRADKSLALPERHLGLVQAGEIQEIDRFIENAASLVARDLDIEAILSLAGGKRAFERADFTRIPPPGRHVAIAWDKAFAFLYPHLLAGWKAQGARLSFFSPLADEAPAVDADSVYLPGGYPELHAARLAASANFRCGMRTHADRGDVIFGECGGYMTLGRSLVDANGEVHEMLGLLPVTTSFQKRKRQLGYRRLTALSGHLAGLKFRGHEFHYSTVVEEGGATRLFEARDAEGNELGTAGLALGNVSGSYMHLIDLAVD